MGVDKLKKVYFFSHQPRFTFVPSNNSTPMIRTAQYPIFAVMLWLMLLAWPPIGVAQNLTVYPGDASNNGVVNNIDFLAIGLAYNFSGPARDSLEGNNLVFGPFDAKSWGLALPGDLNVAYADCNGNGKVNYEDATAIYNNYGERREDIPVVEDEFIPGLPGIDPVLGFDHNAVSNLLMPNGSFSLPILLGTEDIPAEDVYGFAFSVFTSPQFQAKKSFDFTQESWLNNDDDRVFMYKNSTPQRSDIAWTRTDRNQRDGHGIIGVADFIIIVDVIDKTAPIRIWTDSIRMIDKYGNIAAVAGDTITFQWHPSAFPTAVQEAQKVSNLTILPNPARDWLQIQTNEPMQQATLIDALGQVVMEKSHLASNRIELHLPDLPPGFYVLSVKTTQGLLRQIICLQ